MATALPATSATAAAITPRQRSIIGSTLRGPITAKKKGLRRPPVMESMASIPAMLTHGLKDLSRVRAMTMLLTAMVAPTAATAATRHAG